MSDLNTYSFTGRLGNNAETKYSQSGTAVWSARVAVGYGYGDNKGTNWVTVKSFGKRAEGLANLDLAKGAQIAVSGSLQVREFDRNDGTKGTAVEVLADSIALIGSKPDGGQRQERPAREPAPTKAAASGSDFADDDIPF